MYMHTMKILEDYLTLTMQSQRKHHDSQSTVDRHGRDSGPAELQSKSEVAHITHKFSPYIREKRKWVACICKWRGF